MSPGAVYSSLLTVDVPIPDYIGIFGKGEGVIYKRALSLINHDNAVDRGQLSTDKCRHVLRSVDHATA